MKILALVSHKFTHPPRCNYWLLFRTECRLIIIIITIILISVSWRTSHMSRHRTYERGLQNEINVICTTWICLYSIFKMRKIYQKLSWRLNQTKLSRATSRVRPLNGEQISVYNTISASVFKAWTGKPRLSLLLPDEVGDGSLSAALLVVVTIRLVDSESFTACLKDFQLRAPQLVEPLIAKVLQVFMMRTKWWPPRMECSRKCVKSAVAGSRQRQVLQLRVSAGQWRPTAVKKRKKTPACYETYRSRIDYPKDLYDGFLWTESLSTQPFPCKLTAHELASETNCCHV
jgi:hypothetical protein